MIGTRVVRVSMISLALATVMGGVLDARVALANVADDSIAGPSLTVPDSGWVYSGIGFTANINSTLIGFTFENQGNADDIILENSSGMTLDSIATPGGVPSDTVSVNWSLTAGDQYYLLQSTESNSLYAAWGMPGPSDTQISIDDTGIFSYVSSPVDFGITGDSYWAAFNNISTTSGVAVIPEPPTLLFAATGLLSFIFMSARRKSRRA